MRTLEEVINLFTYEHLPEHLRDVSYLFSDLALNIMANVPEGPMRTKALNDLWQSKNWAVAAVAQA